MASFVRKEQNNMSEKRRDKKGRILRNGECQRKDGRYQFDYVDSFGNQKCVYSWKLEETDPTPKGKKQCVSLREKEREILRSLEDGIDPYGGNFTVLDIVCKYTDLKVGIRPSTRAGHKTVINILKEEPFGQKRINKVKIMDAKAWLIKLQRDDGRSYSSIHSIRGVLRPAFQMAVDDDMIRKNPFDFPLVNVIVDDSVRRDAITHKQKRNFLEFVKSDKYFCKYYDAIYILFYTGMRISEFTGLTVQDLNFKSKTISIKRQLQRTSEMRYAVLPPKTTSGTRTIPMTDGVYECFERIVKNRPKPTKEPKIDRHTGFLFLDKNEKPMVALHWEKYFQHICEKYNKIYKEPMPKVTPHVCRHTYCSHMASSGMNPKHLQYLMGHSDIGVTLNTYTHVEMDNVIKEVKKLEKNVL